MAYWSNYTSDGEGPTKVSAMYQDSAGAWQVNTALTFTLLFYDPFDNEPLGPSEFDERMVEEFLVYSDIQGAEKKKSRGFRYQLAMAWPTARLYDRGVLTFLANLGVGARVRVWPHSDQLKLYFDCNITESNVMSKEVVDGTRYPTYAPSITFRAVDLITLIPHNWSSYHYHFVDKTAWGAYSVAERQRAVTMRDKTLWGTYATNDYVGYFTAKDIKPI